MALPFLLGVYEFYLAEPRQVVIVGEKNAADTRELLRVLHSRFIPHRVVLLVDSPEMRRTLAAWIPAIEGMQKLAGHASAYVCRDYVCQLPVSEPAQFSELLQ